MTWTDYDASLSSCKFLLFLITQKGTVDCGLAIQIDFSDIVHCLAGILAMLGHRVGDDNIFIIQRKDLAGDEGDGFIDSSPQVFNSLSHIYVFFKSNNKSLLHID